MKINPIIPTNYYSCQICGMIIKSKDIWEIEENIKPLCSSRCFFRLVYRIVSKYDENEQLILRTLLKIKIDEKKTPNGKLYENVSVLSKLLLPTMKGELLILK